MNRNNKNLTFLSCLLIINLVSVECIRIDCNFLDVTLFIGNEYVELYTCHTQTVTEPELDNRNLTEVTGVHLEGRNNSDVEGLVIDGAYYQLPFFPKQLHTFLPNIRNIVAYRANISSLEADDLENFPELFGFVSNKNPIISIPAGFFSNNPLMTEVYFSDSPALRHIGENLLGHLEHLRIAYFRNNSCIDIGARTPEDIVALNQKLHILCPPEDSTTNLPPEECPLACSKRIGENTKILKGSIVRIAELEARVEELERIVAEIAVPYLRQLKKS